MSTAHQKQTNDGIARSLTAAGVGSAFHHRYLRDVANEEFFRDWVATHAGDEITPGKGITIVGPGVKARDAFIILARAVHLSGRRVRVVPLSRLIAQIVNDGELLDQFEECKALFVTEFFQTYPGNPNAATGYEVRRVEEFLTDRLDNQGAVFLHTAKPLTGPDIWWSPTFVQRVEGLNRTLEISE